MNVTLSLQEALLGFERNITLPNKENTVIKKTTRTADGIERFIVVIVRKYHDCEESGYTHWCYWDERFSNCSFFYCISSSLDEEG